jgi:hypothetical protein
VQTTEVTKAMIEIHVRIKIDTNDPREAYLQAMGALAFSGHKHVVSDYWLANGKPLPKQVARAVKSSPPTGIKADEIIENDPGMRLVLEDLLKLANEFTDAEEVTQCVIPKRNAPEYTPMFQHMMVARRVDFDVGEAPNVTTPLDFNVGTAEELPPTEIDREISALLRGLRQAE